MIYQHQYFSINTDNREVYDEHHKLLRITGNAYRVLVFLCTKSGTVTEIGEYLDRAKDYTEDHLRQYRYKINSIIGHDVVKYFNNMYSIDGEVKVTKGSNTNLLRGQSVKSGQEDEVMTKKKNNIKLVKWPLVVGMVSLTVTMFPLPYGIYSLNRIIVTALAVYYAYYLYQILKKQDFYFWTLIFIAVLFNPLVPISLGERIIWIVIDIITIIFFLLLIYKLNLKYHRTSSFKYSRKSAVNERLFIIVGFVVYIYLALIFLWFFSILVVGLISSIADLIGIRVDWLDTLGNFLSIKVKNFFW